MLQQLSENKKYLKKNTFIPYGRQMLDEDDLHAVMDVLNSDWLTTGPQIERFENTVADFVGTKSAVAVSSGTAALHATMFAIDVNPGDEVILPPITFAATANAVIYQGGTPVFADVRPDNLLLDPEAVKRLITPRTKAIIAVDYAGHPCDYDTLRKIANDNGIILIADACHALGATYHSRKVGTLADLSVFSFHPVKHITTGEGGMIVTNNTGFAEKMRCFRNHGIKTDHRQRSDKGTWRYEMTTLGYNYRITDFQCALGVSQLKKLPSWLSRRQEIADYYDSAFKLNPFINPLQIHEDIRHAYHLYVVQIENHSRFDRDDVFYALRKKGIGANVHYIPVYLHPYYKDRFGTYEGLCPNAETAFNKIISLPLYPAIAERDVCYVIESLEDILL